MSSNPNIVPIIICGIFTIAGLVIIISEINIRINGICTEAVVVDSIREYSSDPDGGGSWVYYPVFEYYVGGKRHCVKRSYGSGRTMCYIGERVRIIYHVEKHEKITVKNDYAMLAFPAIIIIVTGGIAIHLIH